MHRRLRKRKTSKVDLNLAAMLDMAFQLLTFFILTFKPAPIEGELGLHLPPPVPITKPKPNEVQADPDGGGGGDVEDIEKLDLTITSDEKGDVAIIKNGMRPMVRGRLSAPQLSSLDDQLKAMFAGQVIPLDRVQLAVDERLRYEELMKVIDVCTRQKLKDGKNLQRISFIAIKAPGG